MDDVIQIAGAIAIIGTAFAIIWKMVKAVRRMLREVRLFLEDWHGGPARPGIPAQLGVMTRLSTIENSGASMRYQVDQTYAMVEKHLNDTNAHKEE